MNDFDFGMHITLKYPYILAEMYIKLYVQLLHASSNIEHVQSLMFVMRHYYTSDQLNSSHNFPVMGNQTPKKEMSTAE